MITIPYGIADFKGLRLGKKFYQDRTQFIVKLEDFNSQYPIFLRPRRFGKSLFVSTLWHYYGLEHRDNFQTLFGDLYIGQNPTPLANSYMVLYFEFSGIDTRQSERTYMGFLAKIRFGIRKFLSLYGRFFTTKQKDFVLEQESPETMTAALFSICNENEVPHKIYLLIDEYDHFTNELLSFDFPRFMDSVTRNGFVHKTYETFKTAAGNGIIDRVFITGVSPVTLDSLTSGFNIGKNISTNPIFHDMMGFTDAEVENLLHLSDIPTEKIPGMMDDLRAWYDGYRFAAAAKNHLFNTNMVLNFLLEYGVEGKYPHKMLDTNVASDYSKVAALFRIGNDEAGRFKLLESIVTQGYIDFPLTDMFNLASTAFSEEDFLSLLFYLGMLTIQDTTGPEWRFKVPNYVIKKLYFEYFVSFFLAETRFANTRRPIDKAIVELLNNGDPEPFFKTAEEVLRKYHSNRDEMAYGEKHFQTLMIGLLYPFEAYIIHSEYESQRGYPDIFIERKPDKNINYEIVLELKYTTKSNAAAMPAKIAEAQTQLNTYMASDRFARPDVRGYYVAFIGGELHEWKEHGTF